MMVGVLLAAGASSRMGRSKPLVRAGGSSFSVQCIRLLWTACTNVVAVLGSRGAEVQRSIEDEFTRLVESGALHPDLTAAHRRGAAGFEVHFANNARWRTGMLSSVQAGLRAALALQPRGVLVLPVDHPSVRPASVRALADVLGLAIQACRTPAERRRFAYALVPRYRRQRGHPVALSPALAAAVSADRGARDLSDAVRRNARLVGYLDLGDPGILRNVNRPGD
jgi:CTP:molybdopterin cytidylyltransferase MocA